MNFFLFIQFVFAVTFSQIAYTELRSEDFYPFLVKIEAKGKILDCAGTILTLCSVLTSAHCVEGVDSSQVTVSQINTKVIKYNVTSTVIHPEYNSTVLANDIAVLQIQETFREPWAAVTLNNMTKEKLFPKCNFFHIIGWSRQMLKDPMGNLTISGFSEKPMKAPIKLISNENCSNLIKHFGGIFQGEEKLCGVPHEDWEEAGCFTGPGGPLLCSMHSLSTTKKYPKRDSQFNEVRLIDKKLEDPIDLLENFQKSEEKKFKREVENSTKNLQVGVVSWGKSCSKVPSVYIKTDFYCSWIAETSKRMSERCAPGSTTLVFSTPSNSSGTNCKHFVPLKFFTLVLPIWFL